MCYHVAGEIMPLRPNVAGSVTGAVPTVRGKLKQPRIAYLLHGVCDVQCA